MITSWYQWVLDAYAAGYSAADIRFVLSVAGVLQAMQKILGKSVHGVYPVRVQDKKDD